MIHRYMFRGFYKNKNQKINNENLLYSSISYYKDMVFLYIETEIENIDPDTLVNDGMKAYPNGKYWENMNEIFHYSKPLSKEHWERKQPKTSVWRVNYLKREEIAKYIFYHFQYQEEYPADKGCDKYGIIFNIDNMIIMYLETPCEYEEEKIEGMLATKNTPKNEWQKVMDTLFKPWEDGALCWKPMDC